VDAGADDERRVAEFVAEYKADPQVKRLIDWRSSLRACRAQLHHAAGVVIGDRPLSQMVPLYAIRGPTCR